MAMFFCLSFRSSFRSFICRQRVLVGQWPDWPSSAIVLAAVIGRSADGPIRQVPNILMAAGAYRFGNSFRTDLLVTRFKLSTIVPEGHA